MSRRISSIARRSASPAADTRRPVYARPFRRPGDTAGPDRARHPLREILAVPLHRPPDPLYDLEMPAPPGHLKDTTLRRAKILPNARRGIPSPRAVSLRRMRLQDIPR